MYQETKFTHPLWTAPQYFVTKYQSSHAFFTKYWQRKIDVSCRFVLIKLSRLKRTLHNCKGSFAPFVPVLIITKIGGKLMMLSVVLFSEECARWTTKYQLTVLLQKNNWHQQLGIMELQSFVFMLVVRLLTTYVLYVYDMNLAQRNGWSTCLFYQKDREMSSFLAIMLFFFYSLNWRIHQEFR